ncbi:hypothetical protein ACP70R_046259 [Stipagrostis hirtigluma subsp. patula]
MEGTEAATAPPAPTRRGARAATGRWLRSLAADAVVCCFLVALWLLSASNAASVAAPWACGENCRAAAVAREVRRVALVAVGMLSSICFPFLLAGALEVGSGGDSKRPEAQRRRPESSGARTRARCAYVLLTSFMIGTVCMLMLFLAPAKDSSERRRVVFMLADIGCFLHSVTLCFVVFSEILIPVRAMYAKLKHGTTGLH